MKKILSIKKVNNEGFSLLEVLIAVILLSIMAVPFFRAFAVSAQTNANAKLAAKATTAAENVMEDFSSLPVEKIIAKYAYGLDGSTLVDEEGNELLTEEELKKEQQAMDEEGNALIDAEGNPVMETVALTGYENQKKYTFKILDNDLMDSELPDNYYAIATLDPEKYKNTNSLNIADYNPISVKDSAIFTMDKDYDKEVYDEFRKMNDEQRATESGILAYTYDEIKKGTKRDIVIEIDNPDTTYTETQLCKVKITVKYTAPNKCVKDADKEFIKTEAYLFDNSANKKAINGIYIFFYPRFATAISGGGRDNIIVKNLDNIECDLYLTALGGEGILDPSYETQYKASKALNVEVYEQFDNSMEHAYLRVRTNMLNRDSTTTLRTPYSSTDNDSARNYGLACNMIYNKGELGQKADSDTVAKFLRVGDIDGKALDTTTINTRIYKLNVKIMDSKGTDDTDDDIVVTELDGTKIP